MNFLGLAPKTPSLPTPVAPTPPATTDASAAASDAADRLRKRRGVAATVLAGDSATVGSGSVSTTNASAASKAMLGA